MNMKGEAYDCQNNPNGLMQVHKSSDGNILFNIYEGDDKGRVVQLGESDRRRLVNQLTGLKVKPHASHSQLIAMQHSDTPTRVYSMDQIQQAIENLGKDGA